MNSEPSLPDLYRAQGFTVTPYLQEVIDTYGETEVVSTVEPETIAVRLGSGRVMNHTLQRRAIEFCDRVNIEAGIWFHERIGDFMGSPVAPVGSDLHQMQLLLTEDGRLVGMDVSVIITWGPRGCDWRTGVAAYLNGDRGRAPGNLHPDKPLPPEEQNAPLADLYRDKGFTLTPHLLALIETFGETVQMPPGEEAPLRADGSLDWARAPEEAMEFHARHLITLGADFRLFKEVAEFIGSPVAPVGRTYGQNITLYLTEDGRLIGYQNSSLKAWGPEGCDWRTSIEARLAGEPARDWGVAPLH